MEQDKTQEKKLILYLDDNGATIDCYAIILEITDSIVKFQTSENIITIPIFRLLKIKEKIKEQE